ncbi:ankyrin repeat-containing domain protein [Geopyxis carbonaria]|nr:ankyrin repeat-containing domain protein [Geopyxis carbonaria]
MLLQQPSLDNIATELLFLIASHLSLDALFKLLCVSRHFTQLSCTMNKRAVSYRLPCGDSMLHWAIRKNHIDLARPLLMNGANVSCANLHGWKPLHYASKYDRIEMAQLLIEHGADVNERNDGRAGTAIIVPLHLAKSYSLATLLIKAGANLDDRSLTYRAPIHAIAAAGWAAGAMRALLETGANPRCPDRLGNPPLHIAVQAGCVETVKLLLDAGVDTSLQSAQIRPLNIAAKEGNWEVVELMLDRGTNIESTCASRKTALHYACAYGQRETAKLLIQRGANLEAEDRDGKKPLDVAVAKKNKQIVKLLISRGALIDLDQQARIDQWMFDEFALPN